MADQKSPADDVKSPADDVKGTLIAEEELRKRALTSAQAGIESLTEAFTAALLSASVRIVRPVAEAVRNSGGDLQTILHHILSEDDDAQ